MAESSVSNPLIQRLRRAGHKVTPPRMAVLRVIQGDCQHLTPNEILARAQVLHPGIGRATLYRTLELLTELGIVRPIFVGEQGPTYIRADGAHHHLVCSQCGTIVDFDECIADDLSDQLAARFHFRITSHLLEFYGLCEKCSTSEAPT